MFKNAVFIEYPGQFHPEYRDEEPAPIFRRRFTVGSDLRKATISVCGLGYGDYWLDGSPMTQDRFIAPVSDYNKTLWYNTYDLTEKLCTGEHVLAVMLGNGFFNETLATAWDFNEAAWRGLPKLLLELVLEYPDREERLCSDESWLCNQDDSPLRFNQLHSGETYDARYPRNWMDPDFDDSGWHPARVSESTPTGVLRQCPCQPIRETDCYQPRAIFMNAKGQWVLDFGQNLSGYMRMRVQQKAGSKITVRYCEQIFPDGTARLNDMDNPHFLRNRWFQTDEFICSGGLDTWSATFVYHGFRYVLLEGLQERPKAKEFTSIFVHQMVEDLSEFSCSDPMIDTLYRLGKLATLSNLFYQVTDCPTREKLGWCNDAAASAEQMLQNFHMEPLYQKWLQDIYDAMREDGYLPGIVPTGGWGYEWGSGPISNKVLFDVPYRVWQYRGDNTMLIQSIPYFRRYLTFAETQVDPADGLAGYGLKDWAGPFGSENAPTPVKLTDTAVLIDMCRIAVFAAELAGDEDAKQAFLAWEKSYVTAIRRAYLDTQTGRCKVNEDTAVAMMIALDLYDSLEPMKQQLAQILESRDWHHNCGMLGMQYFYPALDKCGMQADAYKVVTAHGQPSYRLWIELGATTMCEMWDDSCSRNHHMNSCVMPWIVKNVLGLQMAPGSVAYRSIVVAPQLFADLNFCRGSFQTVSGKISLSWMRIDAETVSLSLTVPAGVCVAVRPVAYTCDAPEFVTGGMHTFLCRKANEL